jgi:transketolase
VLGHLGGDERVHESKDVASEQRIPGSRSFSGATEEKRNALSVTEERVALDELCINTIRTLSMDAVQKANSGHPGTPMALAPVAYLLYTRVMRHSPEHPDWPARDRFVLSAGHASMLLYSTLYLTGYGVSLDDIKSFRQLGSPAAGHPEYGHAPGIETTTGPLGQGISTAVGLALGERMLAARFGEDLVGHFTYTIASDGDMEEGVASEASSIAGHLGLGRLIGFYDDNHISIEGDTALAFSEDVGKRYEAYGWHVQNLGEDLRLESMERAVESAQRETDRPSLIILRTHIAPGSPNKQDTHEAHGSPLGEEEIRLTKEAYNWPSEEPFFVPDEALAHFREAVERGNELYEEWLERFEASEHRDELQRILERRLPDGWDDDVPKKGPDAGMIATRKASQEVIQWVASRVPEFAGGSADLAPSTLTLIKDGGSIRAGDYSGRNIHFGIREHGMGAIVNGLNLMGFRAFGAGFLIFSDYMKAAIRIAAIMHLPSTFVFTHDSIGLGEDGPTHQPIEQLATLRATPNVDVVRPAGFNETALAWRHALRQTDRPTVLALSRQGLPVWSPDGVPDEAIERGAYVLRDSEGEPELILMGTGSEVHQAHEAVKLLDAEGVHVRLVSMPCLDRFAEQDQAYRDSVLPPAVRARVAVEAASPMGWHRWVGDEGDVIAMEGFGASAPAKVLYEHFGFSGQAIADRGRSVLERTRS